MQSPWLLLISLTGCFVELHGSYYYSQGGGNAPHFAPEFGVSLGVLYDTPVPRAVAAGNVTVRDESIQGRPGKLIGYPLLLRMDIGPFSKSEDRFRATVGGSGSESRYFGEGRTEHMSQLELFLGGSYTRFIGETELVATLQASGVYSTQHKELFFDDKPTVYPDLFAIGPQAAIAFGIPIGPEGVGAITNDIVDSLDHRGAVTKPDSSDDSLKKMQDENERKLRRERYGRCMHDNPTPSQCGEAP